jgi:hypothetical protein
LINGQKKTYSEWIDLLKQEGQGIEFNDGDDQATLVELPLFLIYLLKLQEYSLSMVCSPS